MKAALLNNHSDSDIRFVIEDLIECENHSTVIDFFEWGECLDGVSLFADVKMRLNATREVFRTDAVVDYQDVCIRLAELDS